MKRVALLLMVFLAACSTTGNVPGNTHSTVTGGADPIGTLRPKDATLSVIGAPIETPSAVIGLIGPTINSVLLPSDFKIIPPDSSVPAELAGFSGKWEGRWGNTLDHTLVVEEIKGNTAVVVYAWGRAPSWFINDPGWERHRGQFKGGELVLQHGNMTVTYRLKNGALYGEYDRGRHSGRATMKRSE